MSECGKKEWSLLLVEITIAMNREIPYDILFKSTSENRELDIYKQSENKQCYI